MAITHAKEPIASTKPSRIFCFSVVCSDQHSLIGRMSVIRSDSKLNAALAYTNASWSTHLAVAICVMSHMAVTGMQPQVKTRMEMRE
jgi:hypothetical protein